MKRFEEIVLLLVLLSYLGLFSVLHFTSTTSFINAQLRPCLLPYSWARSLFALKAIGDYRLVYLSSPEPIAVQVWSSANAQPNPELDTWITAMISETIGQTAHLTFHTLAQTSLTSLSDSELKQTLKTTRPSNQSQPHLRLLYVPQSATLPTNAGAVLSPDAIFIFTQTINQLSETDLVRAKIEQSTIMHEWGHLLGLDHINQANCLMNERVEVFGNRRFQIINLPTQYCPEELYQLRHLNEI